MRYIYFNGKGERPPARSNAREGKKRGLPRLVHARSPKEKSSMRKELSKAQVTLLAVMLSMAILANLAAWGSAVWCERDLAQRGISIEEILKK